MERTQLSEYIRNLDPSLGFTERKQFTEIAVDSSRLHSLMEKLRNDENMLFDFLVCLSGVDYGQELAVVYHLQSSNHKHTLAVKVLTSDRQNPVIDSVSDIWKTADFHEREVYDLLGIRFSNHPDLRRLFLDSSWGFPLRKDYVDDINIVSK